MLRCYLRKFKQIHSRGSIHCRRCRNQVACIQDYIRMAWPGGVFNRVFNVHVTDDFDFHLALFGTTVADTYCVRCGTMIGWKVIAVTRRRQGMFLRAGRFLMLLHRLSSWNHVPLLRLNEHFGANGENADQDGGANEQNIDGDAADQDGDANEQHIDQDGGANEQNAYQDGGVNEQNIDQEIGANERNADQNEGANGQDVGANEQDANQGGGGNEQNDDEDGGRPMNQMKI